MNNSESISIPEELIEQYIQRRRLEISEILSALSESDFDKIAHLAHRMKGNGSSFGFPELSQIGEVLEAAALESDATKVRKVFVELVNWVNAHF